MIDDDDELDPAARALARTGIPQRAAAAWREEIEQRFAFEGLKLAFKSKELTPGEVIRSGICDTVSAQFESLAKHKQLPRHNFKDHEIRDFVNELKAAAGAAVRRDTLSRIVQRFLNER